MKKIILLVFLTIIATSPAKALDFRFQGKAVVDFRNGSEQPITVIMNNNIESHPIASHSQATFNNANIGDRPIFHIKNWSGVVIFSGQVRMLGAKATFEWDGHTF